MKRSIAAAAAAAFALATAAAAMPSAQAATTYTMAAPSASLSSEHLLFELTCDASYQSGPANGAAAGATVDSVVVNVGGRPAGSVVGMNWSAATGPATNGRGSLQARFLTSQCRGTNTPVQQTNQPGGWGLVVPLGAHYLVINNFSQAAVTLTVF